MAIASLVRLSPDWTTGRLNLGIALLNAQSDEAYARAEEELKEWEGKDPILRLRRYLEQKGLWVEDQEVVLQEEAHKWVDDQVKALEEMPPQAPEEMFTSMYAEMPPHLSEQMQSLVEEVRS